MTLINELMQLLNGLMPSINRLMPALYMWDAECHVAFANTRDRSMWNICWSIFGPYRHLVKPLKKSLPTV